MSGGLPPMPYPFKSGRDNGPPCLMCRHLEDQHTAGYCDYSMVPGDMPQKFLTTWTSGNPYKAEPEKAREWEAEYARNMRDLEGS